MRILFAGESGAGHLSPIIAIHKAIKEIATETNIKPLDFMLISSDSHFLQEIFKETGIPYKIIKSAKHKRGFSVQNTLDIFRVIAGFFQSIALVFNYMPDVIFSKGGYISLPVIIVGWIFHIPIIIHESDAIASPVDKFMFRLAKKVAVSFGKSKEIYDSPKVFFSGNPVRDFISNGNKEEAMKKFVLKEDSPVVLILGGSEGAEEINDLVIEILPELLKKYQIIHQCGIGNYEKVKTKIEKMNIYNLENYHIFAFFKKRIANAYAAADIIVSRAGANTVSEIMTVGKPSILIPLASAVSDKQKRNAFHYSESGAAILLEEKNLKPHLLLNVINEIFEDRSKVMEMERAARLMRQPLAAQKIAEEIVKIAK